MRTTHFLVVCFRTTLGRTEKTTLERSTMPAAEKAREAARGCGWRVFIERVTEVV